MLVCLRDVDKSELAKRVPRHTSAPHYERYYSLYINDANATVVDVVDSRARKTFNYDVALRSPTEVRAQVVEPLLLTVLAPDRASQAVVVVDGTAGNRRTTLLDAVEGVLATTARAAAAHPDVASLSFSAATLEDNNALTDILLPPEASGRGTAEATILEDTEEQFTSVEDAYYVALESEHTWSTVLQRVTQSFSDYKHQIYSFIFSFHASIGRPNTTMQFVSFTVSEVARGMKSSRHAVSSAAGLIECSSPTLTFTSTKLLYLLKPALLGQQPGAWLACFSPVSLVGGVGEQETFQEAFAVAQTASRLHSSRIALLGPSPSLPEPQHTLAPTEAVEEKRGRSGGAPSAVGAVRPPLSSSQPTTATTAARDAQTEQSSFSHDDSSAGYGDSYASQAHLVQTPAGSRPAQRAEVGTSIPTQRHHQQSQTQRSAAVAAAAQTNLAFPTPTPPVCQPRESIQRATSEEPATAASAAVRYEFDTYRAVTERAMAKLRADMNDYAAQLEDVREEMRGQRRQSRELRRELEKADASRQASVLESASLRRQLDAQQRRYESTIKELSGLSASSVQQQQQQQQPPEPVGQLTQHQQDEASAAARALREEVGLLEARVGELTELVALHQSEIKGHVSQEHHYRQRILDLEAALRAKERDVIASNAAAAQAARLAAEARHTEMLSAPRTVEEPHSRTSSAVLREDLHDVEDRAEEVECHLRSALDELQRERTQRLQLESLLQQREREVGRPSQEQQTAALLQDLQHNYERQLLLLRDEMTGFRTQLAHQVVHAPSPSPMTTVLVSNESSTLGPPPRPPPPTATSVALSPAPETAAADTSHTEGGGRPSTASHRTSARPSPSRPARLAQSFEEYMKEEPHFELHRASFLRPHTRRTATDTSGSSTQ